jgi:pimeloyl-ACP methyl ester carboxylesterase
MTMKLLATWGGIVGIGLAIGPLGCAMEMTEEDEVDIESEQLESGGGFSGDPVIFVHGCTPPGFTDEESAHDFDDMVAYFAARGYPADHLVLFQNMEEQCTSIVRYAAQLHQLINDTLAATGKNKVDLVGHSMGAVAVRAYFEKKGTSKVRDFVSLGGVQHGTEGGLFVELDALHWQNAFGGYPWFEGIHELFPPYACAGESWGASGGDGFPTLDVQVKLNGCLTPTGRTIFQDETPGNVRYVSVRNTLDEIVVPVEVACLNMQHQNDCSSPINKVVTVPAGTHPGPCEAGCPAHLMMLFDPFVISRTHRFVSNNNW